MQPLLAALVVCALGCNIPPSMPEWEGAAPSPFTTGPYVVMSGPGHVYIAMKMKATRAPVVEWWTTDDPAAKSVPTARTGRLYYAELPKLPPGTKVSYRVQHTAGVTDVHEFEAGVAPGQPFRFAIFGDTRTQHDVHRAVVDGVINEDVQFVVNTGDLVDRGGVDEEWTTFFQIERPLLVDTPVLAAVGNHDKGSRNYFDRYFLFTRWNPGKHYYAHDVSDYFRLVVVDEDIDCNRRCAQYKFADRALADAAERDMLTAIALHWPPYSSGGHGSRMHVRRPIEHLARKHGVELVIAGHDHHYERSFPIHGTTYIVSGSAGAPIRPVDPRPHTAESRTEPHFMLADVSRRGIALRAVNVAGVPFDNTFIGRVPPGGIP